MKIIRAEHLGMCFGVRDAIALAQEAAAHEPVTVLGQLVHNRTVLDRMRQTGVEFAERPSEVRTRKAVISAHGASDRAIGRAEAAGLQLVDTTCPLVGFAHRAVRMLVGEGFHPVVIGKRDHVEVRGLTEDLPEVDILLTEEEVERLVERSRFGVCAQTTQPINRVRGLVTAIQRRFPRSEVRFVDTVCQPTKQRQQSAVDLAAQCDVVVVVGGANSNNTRELVETCRTKCQRVHHVQLPSDLHANWFREDDVVGLTAGTSTPDDVIQAVEMAMSRVQCKQEQKEQV
ncbi:MAG: 4-hydroxy-3-methylbut-2-enyl diphosphate reductase [Limisphaerales bacterium]